MALPAPRSGVPGQTPTSHLGRPSSFSEEITLALEEGLRRGDTLTTLCAIDGMPCITTVMEWQDRMPDFAARLARARRAGADALVTDSLTILKESTAGKEGTIQVNREVASHQRWMAARMNPQDWGDKQQVQVSGGVTVEHVSVPEWLGGIVEGPSPGPVIEHDPTPDPEPDPDPLDIDGPPVLFKR